MRREKFSTESAICRFVGRSPSEFIVRAKVHGSLRGRTSPARTTITVSNVISLRFQHDVNFNIAMLAGDLFRKNPEAAVSNQSE